jgi:hypothetical protein
MRSAILLLLPAVAAAAGPFSAGVKAGLPLTDFLNTVSGTTGTATDRYLVGPTAELHLPFGLGVEVDAIYRHFDYKNIIGSTLNAVTTTGSSGDWEFPLLLKYRFPSKVVRPYIDAGIAWDKLSGLTNSVGSLSPAKNTTTGGVVGFGADVHLLVIHILPEIRYTRWTSQHFNIANVLNSNQDQAEFMVGITF